MISNVDGLQSALDRKLGKFTSGGIASCNGNGKYSYFKILKIKRNYTQKKVNINIFFSRIIEFKS